MASSLLPQNEPETGSGMPARIRAFDWSATPLGPMESWPDALRTVLDVVEHSAFPMAIYWGRDLRLIYNDAWAPIPGERHPEALGQPAEQVWADIWPIVGPQFADVLSTGRGFSAFEQLLPMVRGGVAQETYWNYSFSPIFDRSGQVAGILNQGNEITRAVVNQRRLTFQVTLADRLRGISEPSAAKETSATMLGEYLGAARVGFAEVDEEADRLVVKRDWVRDPDVPSLAGGAAKLSGLSSAALSYLRTGEVLAIADVASFTRGGSEADAALGSDLGVRAVITVPLVRDGRLRAMLFVHEPEPREWKRSEAAIARDVAERTWAAVERAESEQRLRESEDHYRHTVELNPQVTWTALPDGQLNRVGPRWQEWTGTSGLGDSWAAGLHPDDREATFDTWGRSVATSEPYDIEHRVQMVDGSFRWARSRAFPRRDDKGAICLWYGSTEDIHEKKVAEEHQRLLINELNHRVKNTLATVQAIAFQTLKSGIPTEEARARFEARLMALSRAHNLLTERNWDGALLERVVADATAHLAGERIEVSGDSLWLGPRAALALALAFHELSTNAAKYGALSRDGGVIAISWKKEGDSVRLEWKERGGPPVSDPPSRGFGSRLLERGLAADLGGGAVLHFEPDGLRCLIHASLQAIQASAGDDE